MFGRTKKILPKVPIFGFIGIIPENYGGRTAACFQRTSALADADKRSIEILNVSPVHAVDVDALNAKLHSEGRLSPRVALRNLWNDMRTLPDDQLAEFTARAPKPFCFDDDCLEPDKSSVSRRYATNGTLLQTDWFRTDGTRAVSDRRDVDSPGRRSGRAISVFNNQCELIGQWQSSKELFKDWFKWIFGHHQTILISDTPSYSFIRDFDKKSVKVIQAIHSIHGTPPNSSTGRLSKQNYPVLTHMDEYDRVALLTASQRRDLADLHIGSNNMAVLPNMVVPPSAHHPGKRNRSSAVILSRLIKSKRLDHAIKGIFEASKINPDIHLDIFGDEIDAQEELENLIGRLNLAQSVHLRGYDPQAKQKFSEASFCLLTSRSEGQSLVVLEGMAAGCIPISYDISYGPPDIITHGVDGFLVPDGNVEALGNTIAYVSQMPEAQLKRMRKAAIQRSQDFSPAQITSLWGDTMRQVLAEKNPTKPIGGKISLRQITSDGQSYKFKLNLSGVRAGVTDKLFLTWMSRDSHSAVFGREPVCTDSAAKNSVSVEAPRLRVAGGNVIDFYVDLKVGSRTRRTRLPANFDQVSDRTGGIEFYVTKNGFLSARIG
ncbi:glycosyltransferase [Brevibacterium sp. BDJS002]|uniref:glycosyltransferase n=1 Tax=Brevibacterium sp. BDJS002 TaxID=3020906 RepID=UPI002306DE6E|nr:glycosyltransferase [Brevibacterium sp. BDJS002]WCE39361.1 glycosyltransferase [Brevibacterium sp. BDJS002]